MGSAEALRSFVPEQNHRPTLTSGGLITQAPRTQRQPGASPPNKRTQFFGEVPGRRYEDPWQPRRADTHAVLRSEAGGFCEGTAFFCAGADHRPHDYEEPCDPRSVLGPGPLAGAGRSSSGPTHSLQAGAPTSTQKNAVFRWDLLPAATPTMQTQEGGGAAGEWWTLEGASVRGPLLC